MGTKICTTCKEEKTVDNFRINDKRGYLRSNCKDCGRAASRRQYQKHKDKITKKRMLKKDWLNKKGQEYFESIRGRATHLRKGMKRNGGTKGFPEPEWTVDEIEEILKEGKCYKTGLPFSFKSEFSGTTNPFSPSPDRIDNTKGYTKDNVRWVCWFINQMKSDHSSEELDILLKLVKAADILYDQK